MKKKINNNGKNAVVRVGGPNGGGDDDHDDDDDDDDAVTSRSSDRAMSSSSGEPQKNRRVSSNLCRSASASLGHLDRRRGDGSGTMTAGSCDDGCGGGAPDVGGRGDHDFGHDGHGYDHDGHGICDGGSMSGGGGGGGGGSHVLRRHQSEFGSLNCLHNRPRTLMESLLIAKMERASLNGGGGHQYGSHPSLVRTDSIGSTSSLDSMSSMSSDVCRCDDCLLGIADLLYINTFAYEGRRKVCDLHTIILYYNISGVACIPERGRWANNDVQGHIQYQYIGEVGGGYTIEK